MSSSNSTAYPNTGNISAGQAPSANTSLASNYDRAIQKRLMGNIKQRLKEDIPESGFQYKPYVFSEADFQMKMAAYLALNDRQTSVDSVDDFPTDPEAQRDLVQDIVEAMLNMDENTLIDPQAKLPLARIRRLSPFELDLMAWNVLIETRDAHRGTISLPSWGKDWPWEEFPSFSERFKAVRDALFHCKAMVASLFDEIFAKRLPLNPTAEFSRKNNNKKLNGKRKQYLELAKGAKKEGFVPSSLRQTIDAPTPSISRLPSGPESTRPRPQPASSTTPAYKRRMTSNRAAEGDYGFNLDQDTDVLASRLESPQFDRSSMMDDLDSPALDEFGSSTNDSVFTPRYTPKTISTLASSPGSYTGRGRSVGLDGSNTSPQSLSANGVHQRISNTAVSSNQHTQQPMGSSLGPGLFRRAQVNPASSGQRTSQAILPSQNDHAVFQGGQKRTSDCSIAQAFNQKVQSASTYGQRETIPATSIPQKPHPAGQQNPSTPARQLLPKYLPGQGQDMYGNPLHTSIVDMPVTGQEVESALDMPDYFDPDLGVWKNDSGEAVDLSWFSIP